MNEQASGVVGLLIVDDQELIRTGLSLLVDDMDGIEVVGAARDAAEALDLAAAHPDIDVALVDARMPGTSGPELIAQFDQRFPTIKCILLTAFDEDDNLINALKAGAVGYLLKDVSAADLEQAIRTAATGGQVLGASAVPCAMQVIANGSRTAAPDAIFASTDTSSTLPKSFGTASALEAQTLLDELTEREREIAYLVASGKTNSEIAKAVFLSTGTVKNHISHIFQVLCVRNRTELTALMNGTLN